MYMSIITPDRKAVIFPVKTAQDFTKSLGFSLKNRQFPAIILEKGDLKAIFRAVFLPFSSNSPRLEHKS